MPDRKMQCWTCGAWFDWDDVAELAHKVFDAILIRRRKQPLHLECNRCRETKQQMPLWKGSDR